MWLRGSVCCIQVVAVCALLQLGALSASATATPTLPLLGPGTYSDDDPGISYSDGWTLWTGSGPNGDAAHHSAIEGTSLSVRFEGASITWIGAKGPGLGVAELWIDTIRHPEVDLYSPGDLQWQVPVASYQVAPGEHLMTITVTRSHHVNSSGYDIVVDGFVVGAAPTATPTPSPTATPTPIPTPTATPTPVPEVALEVRVALQRPLDSAPSTRVMGLALWLFPSGGANPQREGAVHSAVGASEAGGGAHFQVPGLSAGRYDVSVKGSHTLGKVRSDVWLGPGSNLVDLGTLLEGDANSDNRVDLSDFVLVASAFGTRSGDPGFTAGADLDQDGVVDIADVSLLAGNFGRSGDVEVM